MKSTLRALVGLSIVALAVVGIAFGIATPGAFHQPAAGDLALLGMGGIIVNRENLNTIYTGFKTAFQGAFSGVSPDWNKVATLVPSATKTEDYAWLSQWPKLREWIGDRQIKSIAASGYQITNKKFESSVGIPRDDIEDDTYGVFTPLFSEMGYAAATHPDELVFALLAAGATTECYDGQYFFDTDHPVGAGTVSNNLGGAGTAWYLLDTSRPLKPLIFQRRKDYSLKAMTDEKDEAVFMRDDYRYGVDARCNVGFGFWQMAVRSGQTLDETNYGNARAAMMAFKSDEGRPLGVKPTLLVVPPALEAAALKLVQAENNAAGASNIYRNSAQVLVCPWLT